MKKPNLLLVTLDGLRADVAYSGKLATLEELRRRGVTFRRVVSQAPLTPISHSSVFTGLYPPRHGVRHLFLEQLAEGIPTFTERLREAGYATRGIVSCPALDSWYGICRGFEHWDDEMPALREGAGEKARGGCAKRATEVAARAVTLLDDLQRQGRPFFLFLHFFDAHWPYQPPEPYGRLFPDNPYEGEAVYLDATLGSFLRELEARGLDEDLVIAAFADHGEDLAGLYPNDHGGEALGHPEEEGHGCLLYDATQMVPLVMVLPGRAHAGREVQEQVRLVDIGPTLLDLAGAQPLAGVDGASLRDHLEGRGEPRIGYSETLYPRESPENLRRFPHLSNLKALRIARPGVELKIIWHLDSDVVEVYDLIADPNERANLGLAALSELAVSTR